MNKLKELKKYIQKEIPEISNCPICGSEKGVFRCSRGARNCADCMQYVGEIKISLEDVLRVSEKNNKKTECCHKNSHNCIINGLKNLEFWTLGKPLDQQSEKTIEFLHELLTKK